MREANERAIEALLHTDEPSLHWKVRVQVLAEEPSSLSDLQDRTRLSPRVQTLLAQIPADRVYNKWHGAHWVLAALADLGFPPGTAELIPLRDRVVKTWLGAKAKYYSVSSEPRSGTSPVDWGGTSRHRRNPWVTAEALAVLAQAGRL